MPEALYFLRRIASKLRGGAVHLHTKRKPKGSVLISYTTLPYLDRRQIVLDAHTNRWECMQIARTFLEREYDVDIIDGTNKTFVPKKSYEYFIDESGQNMNRVAPFLSSDCIKIFYGATCHWRFLNDAEQSRLDDIERKRGVRLPSVRKLPPSNAFELSDVAIMLGSDFTLSTYPKTKKDIARIPLSTTHTYPSPEGKDFEKVRNNFMWFGGAGLAHKGLDLVLESFAGMPEFSLTVCGKIDPSDPFSKVYKRELYETENIHTFGWLDPGGNQFKDIYENSLGIVYPSSSEGCAGSVVLCMHAGIIPIVSIETGVETSFFGITLKENTVQEIQSSVLSLSYLPAETLKSKALATWEYANSHHTRDKFADTFGRFVDELEKNKK